MFRQERSVAWRYFTKKDQRVAECNLCSSLISYKTAISNLTRHLKSKHPLVSLVKENHLAPDKSNQKSITEDNTLLNGKSNPTWKYYEILDSDKFEANCKLCGENIPYETVSDLAKHVREHGETTKDSDDDDDYELGNESETQEIKVDRRSSSIWQFYSSVDTNAKVAQCVFCKKFLSFSGTTSNLKRHLIRKHPQSKRMIVTADGKMYEMDPESQLDDDEKDPIEMDTVYLEELEESADEIPTPKINVKSIKKKEKKPYKRHFEEIAKEQQVRRTSTSNHFYEQPIPTQNKTTTMGPLDYFGQYVVSLLKEMPKSAADQLQNEIILQIFRKKASLEPGPSKKYEITVSDNHLRQPNEVITEPVTVTIHESDGAAQCVAHDDIGSEVLVQDSMDVKTST